MTVQDLFNRAVLLIGDYSNISSYTLTYITFASQIVGELVRLGIGVEDTVYTVNIDSTYSAAYTPTDTDYKPVLLPTALTTRDQITGISLEGYGRNLPTETNSGSFYLLIPSNYYGTVEVSYSVETPNFTAMTDTLPISDAAVDVAAYGLASLLALEEAPEKVNFLESKFNERKRAFNDRDKSLPGEVQDLYDFGW